MSAQVLNITDLIKYRTAKKYIAEVTPAIIALSEAYNEVFKLHAKYPEYWDIAQSFHENLPYLTLVANEALKEIESVENA